MPKYIQKVALKCYENNYDNLQGLILCNVIKI